MIREIETLTINYPDNQYLMTCRIAAREYTFEKFTEVEIADFDWQQITAFTHNWFKNKVIKAETFLERLEKDEPIKELVSSPLLLTLLCISFEELGDFSANRKELYEEGLDTLLKKWDAKRGLQRDNVYKPLSVAKKEDLLSKRLLGIVLNLENISLNKIKLKDISVNIFGIYLGQVLMMRLYKEIVA